jgi:hypothetical protein
LLPAPQRVNLVWLDASIDEKHLKFDTCQSKTRPNVVGYAGEPAWAALTEQDFLLRFGSPAFAVAYFQNLSRGKVPEQ